MIPRLNDSLVGNLINDTVSSLKAKALDETGLESYNSNDLNNLKDITNLNSLKENNYSSHHSSNMKMDLVIYDDSIRHCKLQQPLTTKLQQSKDDVYNVEDDENQFGDLNTKENSTTVQPDNQQPPEQNQLGLIGLTNLGNTCYMNSGLQCLFNNKRLIVFFLNEYLKNSSKINLANNSLTSCFISLMKKVWNRTRDYSVIKPYEFKEIMSQNYSQFQGFRQHDCQEFLTLLLGTLHDQINQGLNNKKNNSAVDDSRFDSLEKTKSNDNEESPLSNCSNDLMDLSSRTTSPKSSVSVSTSSTYCDQLSEEETDNLHATDDKKEDQLSEINNQTVINPIHHRLIPATNHNNNFNLNSNVVNNHKLPVKTISKDELKNSLQLSVKELVSKDTKLINTNLNLNQELSYDSKKFLKTSIDNELICSTAKQLNSQQIDNTLLNDDYSDRCSDSASTTSSTISILKRNKKRNNSNCTSINHHLNSLNEHLNEFESADLNEKYNSPKRMKVESDHESSSNEQQFETLKNEKFSSEIEWNKYLTKNKSIIVDTFQGQFKSTVKCSTCLNVSITYEPFMYLPINLPNALERQMFVTFIPSSSNVCYNTEIKSARRYLITLNKHDKLEKLSNLLRELLIKDQMTADTTQFVFAEVVDKYINKVLDNNTFLKYVDDKFRDLYAFEMTELTFTTTFPTMPKLWDTDSATTVDLISPTTSADQSFLAPNSTDYDLNGQNTFINNPTFINDTAFNQQSIPTANKPSYATSLNNDEINLATDTTNLNQINDTKLPDTFNEDCFQLNVDRFNKFFDYLSTDKLNQDNDLMIDNLKDIDFNTQTAATSTDQSSTNQYGQTKTVTDDLIAVVDNFDTDTCNLPIPLSCAICLEEKDASQLLIHPACSCQLCPPCLDMTVKHYSENENNFLCPTCSLYIDKTDFVPFGSKRPQQQNLLFTTNYYLIPILFRIHEKRNYNNFKLVIRPILLRLPNLLSGRELYEIIDRFVPAPIPYSLCFVTKSGQRCIRCDWGGNCSGCEITRIGDVFIYSSDNIAVEFESSYSHELDSLMPDSLKQIFDHPSIHDYKKPEKLTLHECLKSFNQSEVLDDDNPWFCHQCNSNQKAKKALTIWKSPDTLIVYLKRFVFHDMNSIKIDEPVEFPIEKFDISPYYQVDNKYKDESEGLIYDLKSIICHSGNMLSGHYTAFSKSAWNNKWYYFNDESVLELEPSSSDERAYILFYQRSSK